MRYLIALLGVILVLGTATVVDFAGWLGANKQWSRAAMGLGLFGGPILGFAIHAAKIPAHIRDVALWGIMSICLCVAMIASFRLSALLDGSAQMNTVAFFGWVATSTAMGALLFSVLADVKIITVKKVPATTKSRSRRTPNE